VTGAQIITLSMLAFYILIIAQTIKNVGVVQKASTPTIVSIVVFIQILMGAGVLYLYVN
jgi:hypothetical protein